MPKILSNKDRVWILNDFTKCILDHYLNSFTFDNYHSFHSSMEFLLKYVQDAKDIK